jgi:hypothetical protein
MSMLVKSCIVMAAAFGLAASIPSASYAEDCREFGAVGSGLNESIATLMAKQGAVNVAEARGYTVQGEAKLLKCASAGIFGTECTAKTHACIRPK